MTSKLISDAKPQRLTNWQVWCGGVWGWGKDASTLLYAWSPTSSEPTVLSSMQRNDNVTQHANLVQCAIMCLCSPWAISGRVQPCPVRISFWTQHLHVFTTILQSHFQCLADLEPESKIDRTIIYCQMHLAIRSHHIYTQEAQGLSDFLLVWSPSRVLLLLLPFDDSISPSDVPSPS